MSMKSVWILFAVYTSHSMVSADVYEIAAIFNHEPDELERVDAQKEYHEVGMNAWPDEWELSKRDVRRKR